MSERIPVDLLVDNAAWVATLSGHSHRPKLGLALRDLGLVAGGAVACAGGRIAAVGPRADVRRQVTLLPGGRELDARGGVVTPGLIDPHTHLIYGGDRVEEFTRRLQGATYLELQAAGGGINATVRATRAAADEDLLADGRRALRRMLALGTTTVEAKTGYELTVAGELRALELLGRLGQEGPVKVIPTFMGAHAFPPEWAGDHSGYVELIVDFMLPAVASQGLAVFCDVFCESGAFSIAESRRVLEAAKRLGLKLKLHAEEFTALGGAQLAAELGATSADHLLHVTPAGIRALAAAGVVAVLLPGTVLTLGIDRYAPARAMIEGGVAIALATDYNPGSSPVDSMPLVLGLASRTMRLTPAETLSAATINAAHAVGVAAEVGSLEAGKRADLAVFEVDSPEALAYHLGSDLTRAVVAGGSIVRET
ncbi:MAG: imidazolonepropionase [Bacillota bacterium]